MEVDIKSNAVQGVVLSKDPLIIYTTQIESKTCAVHTIGRIYEDKNLTFLILCAWTLEDGGHRARTIASMKAHIENSPKHRLILCCNTIREVELVKEDGYEDVIFANHNIFVDHNKYDIEKTERKIYDSVYNAQINKFKRHHLASGIHSLALIYYMIGDGKQEYLEEVIGVLPHAYFCNKEMLGSHDKRLSGAQVREILGMARTGLCLSAVEGAMHSSIEYLLCGLPVVSTSNIGGRDLFLSKEFSVFVDDNPEAVAKGVEMLIKSNIEPSSVRQLTIQKQIKLREDFIDFIDDRLLGNRNSDNLKDRWSDVFCDKLLEWTSVSEMLAKID